MSNTAYSPIRHFADALFINYNADQRYFAVLTTDTAYTTYFDASGHPQGTSMLVVGGFIATVEQWRSFESEWNKVLAKYGVPYFHMKKFTAKKKPFDHEKWQRDDVCTSFLGELIGVLKRNNCYGLMVALPLAAWATVNKEFCMEEERLTPFAVAGCMAITGVYEWCQKPRPMVMPYQVEFIFEDGDEDKGDLMYWTKRSWKWVPAFKGKKLAPLQACDFLAWEGRRAATDLAELGEHADDYQYRGCFRNLLSRIEQENRQWDEHHLRRLCGIHNITKR